MQAIIPAMAKMATTPITTPTIQIMDFFFGRETTGVEVGTTGETVTVGRAIPDSVVAGRGLEDVYLVLFVRGSYLKTCLSEL